MLPLRTLCAAKLTNLLLSSFQKPLKRLLHIPIAYDTGWTLSKWTQVIQSLFSTSTTPQLFVWESGSVRLGCRRKTLCTACTPIRVSLGTRLLSHFL